MDLFPTVLRAAGGDPAAWELDGTDLTRLLESSEVARRGDLFWESGEQTAIRRGDYKLLISGRLDVDGPSRAHILLTNLLHDPGESVNLASDMPDLAGDMLGAALDWRKALARSWKLRFARNFAPESD